jgi:hypothetical protein
VSVKQAIARARNGNNKAVADLLYAAAEGRIYETYAGDPNGNVVPHSIGQKLYDTTNKHFYVATGATNNDWDVAAVVDLTAAELAVIDGVTPGTQAASKAVVADANVNTGVSKVTALHIGASGSETQVTSTGTELNLLDGSVVANSVASKAALVDSNKQLQTNANNGTPEANVTAVHYGDGVNVTAVLTLTDVVLAVGSSEDLGVGALLYTLPAGACLIRDSYMSVDLSDVTTTTDTPEVGLGTVIASGVVAVLSGTATFEDIITGQVATDTGGTPTVKGAGPTAGAPLEITTAGAHTVYLNMADGWGANADQSGLLNGTVVISYIRQAA